VVGFLNGKNNGKLGRHVNGVEEVESGICDDMSPALQRRRSTSQEKPEVEFRTGKRRLTGMGLSSFGPSPIRSSFAGVAGRSGMGKSNFLEDSFGKFQEIVKKKTDFIIKNRGILTSEHISQVLAFDSLQSEKIHKIKKRLKLEQKAVKKRILFQEQLFIKAHERQKILQQKQMVRNKTTLFKGRLGMKVTGAENRSATSSKDLDNLVRFFWNRILLIFQNEFLASNLLTLAEFLKHARI
jgi:replicative DNA helicase